MHLLIKLYFQHICRSFSQIGQDRWCIDQVHAGKKNGYFVEFGALDGLSLSNTALLEFAYGWTGVCIDPNPTSYAKLKENRRCTTFGCAVGESRGRAQITLQDEISEIVTRADSPAEAVEVDVRPLVDILAEANAPKVIDFMSVDVEGFEDQALLGFPLDEYQVLAMCVERPSPRLRKKLQESDMLVVRETPGLDVFMIHRSMASQYAHLEFISRQSGPKFFVYRILRKLFS
jgi:FkbM family methyltransferase